MMGKIASQMRRWCLIRLLLTSVSLFGCPSAAQSQEAVVDSGVLSVTGTEHLELLPLDEMMGAFMREHSVPGGSLAVSKNGVLVYSRGFGTRDVKKATPVLPSTRFRIASISKSITSAAIASLVKSRKLSFDDPFISFLSQSERAQVHPQIRSVTIKQLLQHRGGWDRSVSSDPMFETIKIGNALQLERPATQAELIRFVLQRAPDFEPGTKFAYSNFGYCLLGRVIESVSNQSYGDYVKFKIGKTIGATSFDLAKTLTTMSNETKYFVPSNRLVAGVVTGVLGKRVPTQYGGWCIENMDSHGGWIASAEDLVAFADAFNRPDACDFLASSIVSEVFAEPTADRKDVFYGYGWLVRRVGRTGKVNTWHNGSLPGTSSLLVRRHDGFSWAVLFNTRDGSNGKSLSSLIDPLIHQAVNRVEKWPGQASSRN
jgi:N-acyl-D-amino-acid deacylase